MEHDNDERMLRVSGRDIRRRVRLVVLHRVPSRVFSKGDRGHWVRCLPCKHIFDGGKRCLSV